MAEDDIAAGNHPLIFHRSPLSLQVLASAKIASNLWRNKIDSLKPQEIVVPWSWIYEDQLFSCGDCVDLLGRVPSAIARSIDDALQAMLRRILVWVHRYSRRIFRWRDEREIMAQIFYDVEVDDDDDVTARRLLLSDKVTCGEKYAIACMFCLEEDVVGWWPSVEKNTSICEVAFEVNVMIYYWNCTMKKIPVEGPENPNDSIDLRMISYGGLSNFSSIWYFWRKLSYEERTLVVGRVLTRDIENEKIIATLLSDLDHKLVRDVLESSADKIITALARKSCTREYVVEVWAYFCEFASVEHQFQVFSSVFQIAYLPAGAHSYRRRVPARECFRVSEVLYELWIRAPESFKTYVVDNFVEEAFDELCDIGMVGDLPECYDRDMRFFLDFLSRIDFATRQELWCENWQKLIIIAKPRYLDRFLRICFETDEQIVRFKQSQMMDYDQIYTELLIFIDFGFFDELSEYVRFCSEDRIRVENLRRRIIASQFYVTTLSDRDKCQKFLKFIDDTFETAEQASTFKEELLTSPECEMLKEVYDNLDRGCIRGMINVRYFLYSKTRTDAVKQECLSHCRRCLVEAKFVDFVIDDWKTFVFWCCETRSNWWAFRRSLPIDEIFEKLLTKVIKGNEWSRGRGINDFELWYSENQNPTYKIFLSFAPVDNFFLWLYFKQDIVNNYKEAKLRNRSSRVIRTLLQKNWGKIVDMILMWLLNNDEKRVMEVKATIDSDASTSGEA